MAKLILVRHGKSIFNVQNIFTGWADVALAPKGVAEAKKAGEIIKKQGIDLDMCFCSYLKRAVKTAWVILETADMMQVDCLHSWKLNERHYGDWQGKDKDAVKKEVAATRFDKIHRGYDTRPPLLKAGDTRQPKLDPKYKNVNPDLLPAGESLKDTEKRVVNYYFEAIVPQLMKNRNVLLSAHGNSLRALKEHIEKSPIDLVGTMEVPTGIPYCYEFDEEMNLVEHYELH